jgi:Gpi18-like mannosyltransferase
MTTKQPEYVAVAVGDSQRDPDSRLRKLQRWTLRFIRESLETEPLPAARLGKRDWLWLCGVFLFSRLLVIALGVIGTDLFPQYALHGPLLVHPLTSWGDWSRLFDHFDSGWYLSISHGYQLPSSGHKDWLTEWAFFPLYSIILHPISLALGFLQSSVNADILAGVIVSYLACVGWLAFLYKLTMAELSTTAARRTVLFQAIFPASLFLSVVYPEALFLLTSVAAFYAARRRAWAWAGFLTAAALLTRPQGLFLLAPLALEYIGDYRKRRLGETGAGVRRLPALLPALWLGVPLLALAGYALYSRKVTGYWLAFSASASIVWKKRLTPPIYPLIRFVIAPRVSAFQSYDFQPPNFLFAVLFLALVVVAWQRLPAAYGLWLLLAVLFPLSTNGHYFFSFARYVVTAFPGFIALAAWTLGERSWLKAKSGEQHGNNWRSLPYRQQVLRGLLVILPSLVGLALYVVLFVNGYPAAI